MNMTDLLILAVLVAIFALAGGKILRDRRRTKAAVAAGMNSSCGGCPVAPKCDAGSSSCGCH